MRDPSINRISVVVNSLDNCDLTIYNGALVILDEISKLLSYLKCDLFKGKRQKIFMLIGEILRNAKKIIVLDADLYPDDIKTILTVAESNDYYFYNNTIKTRENIPAYIYNSQHVVVKLLLDSYRKKEYFMACFDSLTKMKDLLLEMGKTEYGQELVDKLTVFSSEHGPASISTESWNEHFVMFSPIIVYGVSFVPEKPIKVYAFIFQKILAPDSINQMIQRTRKQSEVHIYATTQYTPIKHNTQLDLEKETSDRIVKLHQYVPGLFEKEDGPDASEHHEEVEMRQLAQRLKEAYRKIYYSTTFRQMTTMTYIPYYLEHILKDAGYQVEYVDTQTDFKLEPCKEADILHKKDLLDKIFKEENIKDMDTKLKDTLEVRINILGATPDCSEFMKGLIMDKKKYLDHRNLERFLKGEFDPKIERADRREFKEDMIDNIYVKLKYYKHITDVLGIKYNMMYNYDVDSKRYNEKITDLALLKIIPEIKKAFRITGTKYNNFDKEAGYERLYKMSLTINSYLFGETIIKNNKLKKRIGKKFKRISRYYINKELLTEHLKIIYCTEDINLDLLNELKIERTNYAFIDTSNNNLEFDGPVLDLD